MDQMNSLAKKTDRPTRVVICCDHGAPAETLRDAVTVGSALMERGHEIAFITGDPISLIEAAGSWVPSDIFEAPVRRAVANLVMKPRAIDGFADFMAISGFDDKAALVVLASLWDRQLKALKPDVIIGFYSPLLWLVAPGHAPTFALGSGLMLPPTLGTTFPRLTADSTPLADETLMLNNANAVLARYGRKELAALSEVLDRCATILYGVPAFDPYLQVRRTLSAGLLGEEPTPTVPPAKQRLAIFLDVYCPNVEQVVLAIGSVNDILIDICVSGITTGMRRFLEEQPHVKVWSDYASLLSNAANASALVHHGVQDVAQRCISLGRPQLVIPWTHEQHIFNLTVEGMRFTWTKPPNTAIHDMAGTFSALLRDSSLAVEAQHQARQLASMNMPDALPDIIERIEEAHGRASFALHGTAGYNRAPI